MKKAFDFAIKYFSNRAACSTGEVVQVTAGDVAKNLGKGRVAVIRCSQNIQGSSKTLTGEKGKIISLFEETKRGKLRFENDTVFGASSGYQFRANVNGDCLQVRHVETNTIKDCGNNKELLDRYISYVRHGYNNLSIDYAMEYFAKNPAAKELNMNSLNFEGVSGIRYVNHENGVIEKIVKRKEKPDISVRYKDGKPIQRKPVNSSMSYITKINNITTLNSKKIAINISVNGETRTIEAPRYLYHLTSKENAQKIAKSRLLDITKNEQLRGLYLFDSENLLTHYPNVQLSDGTQLNLVDALFRQALKNSKTNEAVILKILTESLIRSGQLRIRTQEDFFEVQFKTLRSVFKKLKNKNITFDCAARQLANDEKRLKFRQLVIDNEIMTESEVDSFLEKMTKSLHKGYNFFDCQKLSSSNAVEYIYNKPIPISKSIDMGIQNKTLNVKALQDSNGNIDLTKLQSIF